MLAAWRYYAGLTWSRLEYLNNYSFVMILGTDIHGYQRIYPPEFADFFPECHLQVHICGFE